MAGGQEITQELPLGEVVSKTFDLYRRDFPKYLVLFLVVEAIAGAIDTLIQRAVVLPAVPPAGSTPQDVLNWMPGYFGAVISLAALSAIAALVLYPLAVGGAVKMASEEVLTGRADLVESVRFTVTRIVWLWVVGIVVGIIVSAGFVALVVPGIILSIMFSLAVPVVVIEKLGLGSLDRSRRLVGERWLKTFALFIVFGVVIGVASVVVGAVSSLFGDASTFVSSVLSAFYIPLIPIMLAVYYYSNAARIAPAQAGPAPAYQMATPQAGTKFCTSCGSQIASSATFCPTCGAKQPG